MAGATSPTRRFLMKQPRPVKVRVHVTGEPPRELALGPGQSWNQIADSIDAFNPRLVEALDAAGATIRATNDEQRTAAAEAPEVDPGGDPDDPTVPMQGDSQLETFARLLADAHRSSSERSFAFVEVAFNKIVEIANVQSVRLDKMQNLVDSMQRRYLQAVAGAADGEEAPADGGQAALLAQMAAQFLQGAAMKGQGSNGAPHGNGNGGK